MGTSASLAPLKVGHPDHQHRWRPKRLRRVGAGTAAAAWPLAPDGVFIFGQQQALLGQRPPIAGHINCICRIRADKRLPCCSSAEAGLQPPDRFGQLACVRFLQQRAPPAKLLHQLHGLHDAGWTGNVCCAGTSSRSKVVLV